MKLLKTSRIGYPENMRCPSVDVRKTHDGSLDRPTHYLSINVDDPESRLSVNFSLADPQALIDQLQVGLEWVAQQREKAA